MSQITWLDQPVGSTITLVPVCQLLVVGHDSSVQWSALYDVADIKPTIMRYLYPTLEYPSIFTDGLPALKVYIRYGGKDYVCYPAGSSYMRMDVDPDDQMLSLLGE